MLQPSSHKWVTGRHRAQVHRAAVITWYYVILCHRYISQTWKNVSRLSKSKKNMACICRWRARQVCPQKTFHILYSASISRHIDKEINRWAGEPMDVFRRRLWLCDVHSLCVSCYFTCEPGLPGPAEGGGGELKEEVRKECAEQSWGSAAPVSGVTASPGITRVNSDQSSGLSQQRIYPSPWLYLGQFFYLIHWKQMYVYAPSH